MAGLFILTFWLMIFAAYPVLMAGVWLVRRKNGSQERFRDFMDRN